MKKTVKGLIVASAVAAVVGVGAVSFAAWSGGDTTKTVTDNTTGTVSVIGFGTETTLAKQEKLMPWDQPDAKLNGGIKIAKYTLPTVKTNEDYKITVTVDKKNSWDGDLYVIVNSVADTTASDPNAEGSLWKELNGTDSVFTFDKTGDTAAQHYAYIILDSNEILADMGQSYDITFTLAKQGA